MLTSIASSSKLTNSVLTGERVLGKRTHVDITLTQRNLSTRTHRTANVAKLRLAGPENLTAVWIQTSASSRRTSINLQARFTSMANRTRGAIAGSVSARGQVVGYRRRFAASVDATAVYTYTALGPCMRFATTKRLVTWLEHCGTGRAGVGIKIARQCHGLSHKTNSVSLSHHGNSTVMVVDRARGPNHDLFSTRPRIGHGDR